jgi:hypothetical protein
MQGRTAALRKRLRQVADFEFVDAPHQLPSIVKAQLGSTRPQLHSQLDSAAEPTEAQSLHQQQQQQHGEDQRRFAPKRAWMLLPEQYASLAQRAAQAETPRQMPSQDGECAMDEWQFSQQTAGWKESWVHLQQLLASRGPYDGVLGFSQGSAVAAVLCALQEEALLLQQHAGARESSTATFAYPSERSMPQQAAAAGLAAPPPAAGADVQPGPAVPAEVERGPFPPLPLHEPTLGAASTGSPSSQRHSPHPGLYSPLHSPASEQPFLPWFRFAILCSGFLSPLPEHEALLERCRERGGIRLPSVHVYGTGLCHPQTWMLPGRLSCSQQGQYCAAWGRGGALLVQQS